MSKMFRPPTMLRSCVYPPAGRLCPRTFSTTTPSLSALFNLNGLAHSRESQYLSKERGLPRTEYSSTIQLIRSSEVDPFPNAPGASKHATLEVRRSSQSRGGRQAMVSTTAGVNEKAVRNYDGISHPAQKAIEELKVQLMAVLDENARLRAAALEHTRAEGSVSRGILRVLVFLVGSYGLIAFFWPAALPKYISKETDVEKIAESNAATVAQTVSDEEPIRLASDSDAVLLPKEELHGPQQNRKSRNPLSFLWA